MIYECYRCELICKNFGLLVVEQRDKLEFDKGDYSMNDKKNEIKLYNVLFPFWMLLMFPPLWLIVLPANFIVDSFVLIISMFILKISDKKQWYKRHILKIYGFGILSDIIGSAYMLFLIIVFGVGRMGDELYLTIPALIISAISIFIFNYFITLKKLDIKTRLTLSLVFAIVTAPYTFLVPSSWLY